MLGEETYNALQLQENEKTRVVRKFFVQSNRRGLVLQCSTAILSFAGVNPVHSEKRFVPAGTYDEPDGNLKPICLYGHEGERGWIFRLLIPGRRRKYATS